MLQTTKDRSSLKFPDRQYTNQANSISENAIEAATSVYNAAVESYRNLVNTPESFGEATHLYATNQRFL